MNHRDYKRWNAKQIVDYVVGKNRDRAYFFELLNKFVGICLMRGIRMVFENPWSGHSFLRIFLKQPSVIDSNRMLRGDYMMKPTAYWFWNCTPTDGFTEQNNKDKVKITHLKKADSAGLCSEERSMISPDYARNFICDFILGKKQPDICPTLF